MFQIFFLTKNIQKIIALKSKKEIEIYYWFQKQERNWWSSNPLVQ